MDSLLMRRPLMIKASSGPSDILYTLTNQSWSAQIDTEVAPFASGLSSTIVLDVNIASNPTTSGAVGSVYRLFTVLADDGANRYCAIGKQARGDNTLGVCFVTSSYSALASRSTIAGRKKFVLTHEADSGILNLSYKIGTGDVTSLQLTRTFTTSDKSLKIGGAAGGTNALPASSTVYKCAIYNRVWSASEISAFFS